MNRRVGYVLLAMAFLVIAACGAVDARKYVPCKDGVCGFTKIVKVDGEPYDGNPVVICVGDSCTFSIEAADCDYFADPTCDRAQSKFFYQWKLGGEVKSTESSWAHTFDEKGTYTVDWAVRDPKEGEEDWAEETNDSKDQEWDFTGTITVKVVQVTVTLESPPVGNTWKFAVGQYCGSHHGCHIIVKARVKKNGWTGSFDSCTVKYYVRPEGGSWTFKGNLTPRDVQGVPEDEKVYTAKWNTDGTARGDYDIKVELWINGRLVHTSANIPTVFCGRPTWPITASGRGGIIHDRWLHDGNAVDVCIDHPASVNCIGTAPLLAAEKGTASPYQFPPTHDPCVLGDCLCNRASHGTYKIAVTDEIVPSYSSVTLVTDHFHMMPTPQRTSGEVDWHDSLGDGGYTGNTTGAHDHFRVFADGSAVSPCLDGNPGTTDSSDLLHPSWY